MVYNMKLVCGSRSVAGIKLTKRILFWGSGFIALGTYALIRNDILCNIIIGGDYIILYYIVACGMLQVSENSKTKYKIYLT